MNRRKFVRLLGASGFVPAAAARAAAEPSRPAKFVPAELRPLPDDPDARLRRLVWLFHFRVQHKWEFRADGYSYAGTGRWPREDARAFEGTLEHRMIVGYGSTAIEAIDDWYARMPAGLYYAIFWRVNPELNSERDFDSQTIRWAVHSRFALMEHT